MTDGGFFEPDVLIADQFAAARRRRAALSSEKRLMLAVLENALDHYQKHIVATDRIGRALFAEAAEWIQSTSGEAVFSFENITETLDINPEFLRRGVAAWHKRLLAAYHDTVAISTDKSPESIRAAG